MATVGTIAIAMTANTAPLARGLAASTNMLKAWDATAARNITSGASQIGKGFKEIGASARDVGTLLKDSFAKIGDTTVVGAAKEWGRLIGGEMTGPIRESFSHVFKGIGSSVVGPAAKAIGGPMKAAMAATGDSLKTVYGGPLKKAFSGLGNIAGKLNLAPIAGNLALMGKGFGQAAGGALRLGAGLGSLGLDGAKKAVLSLGSALGGLGSRFLSAAKMAGVFGAAGVAIGAVLAVKAASSAAHLNETISKTQEVFGASADSVLKDADAMNKAFGTSRQEYLDGAAALGGQFQGAGYAEKDAAALSVQMSKLAADVAAFRDVGFDDALGKIRSGLSGEAEPLKAFGLDLSETAVKAEAARMGLAKYGSELDGSAKIQARLSLITKGLSKDSGALAREVQSPANQMAEFWGRLETLGQTIGESFAPALGGALEYVNQFLFMLTESWGGLSSTVVDFISGAGETLMGWAGSVAEFFEIGTSSTDGWTVALGFMTNAWQMLRIGFKVVATAITAGLSGILNGLGWLGDAIDWITKKLTGDSLGIGAYLDRLGNKMADISGELSQSVVDEWSKPWASMTDAPEQLGKNLMGAADKVKGAWANAGKGIQAARDELLKPANVEIGKPVNTLPEKEKKGASKPFGEALKLGSTEAASAILRSRYGIQAGKDSTAANTKETAVAAKELVAVGKATLAAIRSQHNPIPVFEF